MELYSGTDVVKFTDTAYYGPVPEDPTTNSPDPTTQTTNPTSENPNTTSKNSAVASCNSIVFTLLLFIVMCFFKC